MKFSITKVFLILCQVIVFAVFILASTTAQSQNVMTYIPPRALTLAPVVKSELSTHFNQIPQPWMTMALIEHESCISLRHSRCWLTTSALNTKWPNGKNREQGIGLGQITRAWTQAGELRLDTLANLKRMYPNELKDLTWDNISQSPDLQIRAIALLMKSDYIGLYMVPDPVERLKMTASAYNGGRRDVQTARKVCGLTTGCNPNVWFKNVERHSPKSTKILYGNRSARDINLHYVEDIFLIRMPKYQPILPSL